MKRTITSALALCCACCLPSGALMADTGGFNPHDWQVRVRGIAVAPQESSRGSIPGEATADTSFVPELDISYFINDNFSLELILATTKHDMGWQPGGLNLGHAWLLPPTLTGQYHFSPGAQINPYVGAGVNYTIFYNEDPGAFASVKYDDGFGYALQAGADFMLDEHWMINADVKKIFLNTNVSVNGGAVTADVDLDPWIFGLGVGYRF